MTGIPWAHAPYAGDLLSSLVTRSLRLLIIINMMLGVRTNRAAANSFILPLRAHA